MSVSFDVRVGSPRASAKLVIDQSPEPSATPVPSTVVPLVSYSVTVAPISAPLPVNAGMVTLVMLSVGDEPERSEERRVGEEGRARGAPNHYNKMAEATLGLPAMAGSFAVTVSTPSASAKRVIAKSPGPSATPVPSTVVPLVSYSVTVAPISAPLPVNAGMVTLVMLSVGDEPE